MFARRSELQHEWRDKEVRPDSRNDYHPARRSHIPRDPHGRTLLGDGPKPELDGIFGGALGRRHSGGGEQWVQRPDMAPWRISPYRIVAYDRALPADGFWPPGHLSDVPGPQDLQQAFD